MRGWLLYQEEGEEKKHKCSFACVDYHACQIKMASCLVFRSTPGAAQLRLKLCRL